MRLFEIDGQEQPQPEQIVDPLSADVNSLILRLDASNVQKVRLADFVQELNNIINVPIDYNDPAELDNIKELISNTGKADIKGEYVLVNYQAPASPNETDTQKIAMKNIKNKAA